MKNRLFLILATITFSLGYSQSTIDNVLSEIAKNNKTIQANTQYWNAQKGAIQNREFAIQSNV